MSDALDGMDEFMSGTPAIAAGGAAPPPAPVQPAPAEPTPAQLPPLQQQPPAPQQPLGLQFPPLIRPGDPRYDAAFNPNQPQQTSPAAASSPAASEPTQPAQDGTPAPGTAPADPQPSAQAGGQEPPVQPQNPNVIRLSTHEQDVTGWTPSAIQALIEHDNIVRRFQSENSKLRGAPNRQPGPQAPPATINAAHSQPGWGGNPAAPHSAPASPQISQEAVNAAWQQYNNDPSMENHQKWVNLNNSKIQQDTLAAVNRTLNQALAPVYGTIRPIAEERMAQARNQSLSSAISTHIGDLVSYGVDCKTLPADEVASYFRKNATELLTQAAQDGSPAPFDAVYDPAIMQELIKISTREALDARNAIAAARRQAAPKSPAAAVPPTGAAVASAPRPPGQAPVIPIGRAPSPSAQPVPQGSRPAYDPWGHIPQEAIGGTDIASIINQI